MATPFADIYTKINILFEDDQLLSILTDEEYSELLELFLNKSKSVYFKRCKKNLSDIDDEAKQFNETLDDQEQWILAEGCKLVWVERQVNREEKMRDRITPKEYDRKSPANLLDKLILLKNNTKKSLNEMIIDYSFDEFKGFN